MQESFAENYLKDALLTFREYKVLAEKAFAQASDEEFFRAIDAEANSIAVVVKHLGGNMLSRWTDFLTSDGEKPTRDRDAEFELTPDASRAELLDLWERGWACVFGAVEPLTPEDLSRKILIRGQEHTVVEAINRQLTHYAYHTGQIVLLAKHFRSEGWKSLTIPKGKSGTFNKNLKEAEERGEASREKMSRVAPDASLYEERE